MPYDKKWVCGILCSGCGMTFAVLDREWAQSMGVACNGMLCNGSNGCYEIERV